MRYSYLKTTPIKELSLKDFSGGLNTLNREDLILDNQLSDGANLIFKDGYLTSRKGVSFNLEEAIGNFDESGSFLKGLKITDTEFSKDNKIHRVAYALWGDNLNYQTLYIYFVSSDKKLTSAGNFEFTRTSADIYYTFSNIIFLVGRKTKGCGLYAFLKLKSEDRNLYEIYELGSDFNQWLKIQGDDIYTPIVLLNGKGDKYASALRESDFSAEATKRPEKFNMLTPRFKAYFTTDGYSDTFQLPIKRLAEDSDVLCRFYVSNDIYYEWHIYAGEKMITTKVGNKNITMICYRSSANIVFFDEQGNVCPLSRNYLLDGNNLVVEASREDSYTISQIAGCEHCKVYNSNVFFYGNQENVSNIYGTTTANPLYFPENMKTSVGNHSDRICAMAVQNNKLIAFKTNEIYQVYIDKSESELLWDSLVDSTSTSFETKQLRISLIHGSIGCGNRETLAVCGNRLVWLGADAKVYTLATTTYGKENNVYCLSDPISNLLKAYNTQEISSAFAFDTGGYYALCIAESLYMLHYRIKNFGISPVYTAVGNPPQTIAWYVLKLPNQKYYSGYSYNGEINLSCGDDNLKYCVLSSLDGETDNILRTEYGDAFKETAQIDSSITTKFLYFSEPCKRKIIEDVYVSMDFSGEADIILNDGYIEHRQTVFSQKTQKVPIRIAPHFRGVYGLSVTVKSENPIKINSISVRYKNLD